MAKSGKAKYYAGRQPGVYETYDEAKAQVLGFSGGKHKSFKTREDAQAYVGKRASGSPQPSSSQSAATSTSSSSGKRFQPYSATDRKIGNTAAKAANNKAVQYERKQPEMLWSREFEARLISDGWLVAFTDGACSSNGRKGARAGSGVFWANPREVSPVSNRVPGKQTNQCAELFAILRALETDPRPDKPMHIFSDSHYSIQCLTNWATLWIKRGWKTASGDSVENADLIKLIHWTISKRKGEVVLSWVRGHAGCPGNAMADRYAVQGAGRVDVPPRDWQEELGTRLCPGRRNEKIDESWLLSAEEELAALEDV